MIFFYQLKWKFYITFESYLLLKIDETFSFSDWVKGKRCVLGVEGTVVAVFVVVIGYSVEVDGIVVVIVVVLGNCGDRGGVMVIKRLCVTVLIRTNKE